MQWGVCVCGFFFLSFFFFKFNLLLKDTFVCSSESLSEFIKYFKDEGICFLGMCVVDRVFLGFYNWSYYFLGYEALLSTHRLLWASVMIDMCVLKSLLETWKDIFTLLCFMSSSKMWSPLQRHCCNEIFSNIPCKYQPLHAEAKINID